LNDVSGASGSDIENALLAYNKVGYVLPQLPTHLQAIVVGGANQVLKG
jgi:hypothetical protein